MAEDRLGNPHLFEAEVIGATRSKKAESLAIYPMNAASNISEKVPGDLEKLHRDCFACGICNQGGLNLHFDAGTNGVATAVWQPSPAFNSYPDRVHGGVIATLLDSAIVHALFAKGIEAVTAELTIRYLQSVNVNDPVHVTGWVDSIRHGVYLCRAEVHQAGKPAVRASAKFMAMPDATPPTSAV